ncbi:centromere protein O [Microcaecilia unicolor]|uniref:Centromere protein O n=1 Tax=Microcaecilia unicolor TaxID=1415580 RepID=A0A6P7XPS4_9AMPH|nr:centromere protein O [Microcaecilia unicolor]
MEEASAYLREGVLAHLEKLEAYSHKLAVKQEGIKRKQEKLAEVTAKIQRLKDMRDRLRTKVALQGGRPATQLLQKETSFRTNLSLDKTQEAILEMKLEHVKAKLQAYYLTGISAKKISQGTCVCISTAYEGNYLDSYYLKLLVQKPIRISHHSVPPFIPLEQIAKQYLHSDIKRFLSVLFDHLNAYTGRKYQADWLQGSSATLLSGTLHRNSLCDLLSFAYSVEWENHMVCFKVKLVYGDITCSLPTEAIISCEEATSPSLENLISSHSALFRQKPLHEVFGSFQVEGENLSQTGTSLSNHVSTI